jgi:hypothetical protein
VDRTELLEVGLVARTTREALERDDARQACDAITANPPITTNSAPAPTNAAVTAARSGSRSGRLMANDRADTAEP